MQIQFFRAWQTYPILDLVYKHSPSGKLRYAVKQNAKNLAPHYESCMEWIRSDKLDHKWEGDAIPFGDKEFVARFETFLLEEKVEFEPYRFSESLMEFADGITGEQENALAWLFTENAPKEPATEVAEESTSS
jgi:hypothetical protein